LISKVTAKYIDNETKIREEFQQKHLINEDRVNEVYFLYHYLHLDKRKI